MPLCFKKIIYIYIYILPHTLTNKSLCSFGHSSLGQDILGHDNFFPFTQFHFLACQVSCPTISPYLLSFWNARRRKPIMSTSYQILCSSLSCVTSLILMLVFPNPSPPSSIFNIYSSHQDFGLQPDCVLPLSLSLMLMWNCHGCLCIHSEEFHMAQLDILTRLAWTRRRSNIVLCMSPTSVFNSNCYTVCERTVTCLQV